MENILSEQNVLRELGDTELASVAGGNVFINFNNFDSNLGVQAAIGLISNHDSNQGFQGFNFGTVAFL